MKIIMIDQDGVLLDRNYKTTANVSGIVNKMSTNIKIVPNSDTPIERIKNNFFDFFGFLPSTMIGENGAVISHENIFYLTKNISGIENYLNSLKEIFHSKNCEIFTGDSATWIRNEKKFPSNSRLLIIDELRKQTIGFYLRTANSEGLACLDNLWFEIGSSIVKKIQIPNGLEAKDFNAKYGLIIINAVNVSKTDGYYFLRKKYPKAVFYMIGDSDADVINDPSVIHCAVNNASDNLKKNAKFVSKRKITAGLIDCLEWIEEN